MLSWQSRNLARIARSSTSAEVQRASKAADSHEFTKQVLIEWFNSDKVEHVNMESRMREIPSILIILVRICLVPCPELKLQVSNLKNAGLPLKFYPLGNELDKLGLL